MRKLLLISILFMAFNGSAQRYSYRFSGSLTEIQQTELIQLIEKLNFFEEIKIRYKNDAQKGELIFAFPVRSGKTEEQDPYSVIDIKKQLIAFGLEPLSFIELSK